MLQLRSFFRGRGGGFGLWSSPLVWLVLHRISMQLVIVRGRHEACLTLFCSKKNLRPAHKIGSAPSLHRTYNDPDIEREW